jgi:DNA polymerase III delta subunit
MIYFIHGPDALLVRQHRSEILARLDPDGSNTTRVDGRTASPQAISSMVATPAFFGMARVVVVDDLFARMPKDAEDVEEAPGTTKANPAAIELLNSVVSPNALVLVEPSISSVPAAVRKSGAAIEVRAGIAPRGNDLVKWVESQAKNAGSGIHPDAIHELLDAMSPGMWRAANRNPAYDVPPDLDALQQEIIKLATFAHPHSITRDVVETMTRVGAADQIFPMLSAIYGRDLADALRRLSDAIDQGEDHFRLIAQIFIQAELSPPIELGRGKNPEDIARDLGLTSGGRLAMIARSLVNNPVSPRIARITAVDRGQKNGELRTSEDVLFALLASIAAR